MERRRRKQYIINKPFQIRFVMKFCSVVLISAALVELLMLWITRGSTTVAIENTKVVVKPTADFIMPMMTEIFLLVTILSAAVVLVMTILFSHSIAGPVFRFQKETEFLRDGDLTRGFQIRARDQLQDLAKTLNSMSGSLRDKHRELKEKSKRLRDYLSGSEHRVDGKDKEEIEKMLADIEQTLNYFKV